MALSFLVADNDETFRSTLCAALRARGCAVEEAPHGAVAIRLLGDSGPDVVLTEILMPERDGFEVIAAVRTRRAAPILIAMCAKPDYAGLDLLLLASRLGADAALAKPFDVKLLMETVTRARTARVA